MKTLLTHEFWSDPEIEELGAEEKLALLWLMTNSRRDLCGFVEISRRRFEFETCLPFEALRRACEGVGKGFIEIREGLYWVRNCVANQIGRGERLIKNNIGKSMVKQLLKHSEDLRKVFLEEYPEVGEMLEGLSESEEGLRENNKGVVKPLTTPSQGVGKGKGKGKGKESNNLKDGSSLAPIIEQIASAYPKQSHHRETREAIQNAIKRFTTRLAITEQDAAERILEVTKAIADRINQWPLGERLTYAPKPPNFFEGDRWADDPAEFESRKNRAVTDDEEHRPNLGGRKAKKITDLRQPEDPDSNK